MLVITSGKRNVLHGLFHDYVHTGKIYMRMPAPEYMKA